MYHRPGVCYLLISDMEVANRHPPSQTMGFFCFLPADTKKRSLIPIMGRNILLNNLQSNVTAAELDWCVCSSSSSLYTGSLFQFYHHQSSGQNHFPKIFNPRTLSSQPTACTWKRRSRYSSQPWSRSSHHPPSVRPRFCSHTRSAERPTSASSPCSKRISPGHFWYAVLQIDQEKKRLRVMRNVRTIIEGLSSRSTVTMTMLKRDIAEVLSRCCVYFAARKRERSWLHMANNISRISPRAVPQICPIPTT
jgi:hypothetical protein